MSTLSASAVPIVPVVARGTPVLVVGLGVAGTAAALALRAHGCPVRAVEPRRDAVADARVAEVAAAGVEVVRDDGRGGGRDDGRGGGNGVPGRTAGGSRSRAVDALLDGRALVVTSPGVPPSSPLLAAARAHQEAGRCEVLSEPELAWRLSGGRTRIVAVTGTNGKTTTTELLAACLGAPAAGNIGTPLVSLLAGADDGADGGGGAGPWADGGGASDGAGWRPPPLVVAELSSFQLAATMTLRPDVAVVLNLAARPPGLARLVRRVRRREGARVAGPAGRRRGGRPHTRRDAEAAGLLDAHPPPGRAAMFAVDGAAGAPAGVSATQGVPIAAEVTGGRVRCTAPDGSLVDVVAVDALARAAPHDLANVAAAVAVAVAAGADPAGLAAPLRAFRPGRHRLEAVATVDGVRYVDDSKATNPHAAAAALTGFPAGPPSVVWIAGGLSKGLSFGGLAPLLPGRVRAAVTIGTSGPQLAAVARGVGVPVVEQVPSTGRSRPPPGSPARGTRSCSRRRARRWTSSSTTPRAARRSPTPSRGWAAQVTAGGAAGAASAAPGPSWRRASGRGDRDRRADRDADRRAGRRRRVGPRGTGGRWRRDGHAWRRDGHASSRLGRRPAGRCACRARRHRRSCC